MSTRELSRKSSFPTVFDDFFKPWNEWFEGREFNKTATIPPVNVAENTENYIVSIAVPGLTKQDLRIDVDGNMVTISAEKEEKTEESDEKYTRKEYNYNSFSRTFTIPDDVNAGSINANYDNGVLNVVLPRLRPEKKTSLSRKVDIK